jgi:hypothetical protein
MHLLREHTVDLSQLLGERGLDLGQLFISLGRGSEQGAAHDRQLGERRPEQGRFAEVLGLEAPPIETHNRLRAAYNPDGAHLYRI